MSARPNPNSGPAKSRTYFIIGFILLFIMAITWSLDASFVYSSLGAATFFFFLAYYHRPGGHSRPSGKFSSPANSSREQSFSDFFESINRPQSSSSSRQKAYVAPGPYKTNALIISIMIFVGGFFMVIMVSVLFADNATEDINTDPVYEKAEAARYAGDYDSAEYYYRQILNDNPENLDALNGVGIVSLNRQRYDNALSQFDAVLKVDPDYKYSRYNKALTLYYQHNYRQSLSETFQLMKRSPDYFDAMALAGDNYYAQQRYDSAKYWFSQGYDNGVRSAWLCYVLGYLYDKDKETAKAVELYKESLSYDSAQAEIYARLGEIYPGEDGNVYRIKASELK